MFKDYVLKWAMALLDKSVFDERCAAMRSYPGLRHFKNGISGISQWTGSDHKELQRIFLVSLAGAVNSQVIAAVKPLVDFIFLA